MFDWASLPRIVPFATYMCFIVLGDVLGRMGWSATELRWLYAVKTLAVVITLFIYRRHYSELAGPRPRASALLLAAAVGVVVLLLWITLGAGWMVIGQSAGFDPRTDGVIDWSLVAVRLAGGALVVPLMEEVFWRSFLMRWLCDTNFLQVDPRRVNVRIFIATVILFGFEHNLWLAGIVAGAAYSFLYMRSRSLWSPILAHTVTNALLGVWIIFTANWTYW
ncbi:CAAX prenyl protease-related protein [Rugamonas sp.]|uniref:CAAX prenyl protease-related protein n=1 Tax=Rugamonas sp. TaxID=1926287 RepID=UPI0025D12636|nr:CAAX prenyl protease-related protein [Rugamonas sp.]